MTSLFSDAHAMIDSALADHYKTGDYAPLGMALQDHASAVLTALALAIAHVNLASAAGFHRGRIVHGDDTPDYSGMGF